VLIFKVLVFLYVMLFWWTRRS